ncbi:23340_t:CDS:2, partial [Cetraspora pellucida]
AYLERHMTVLENANAEDFNDAVKCNILKSMISRKYAPLRAKYQQITIENQQLAIQRLIQEKYQPYDTLDTYEARVWPLLLEVANNDMQQKADFQSQITQQAVAQKAQTPALQTVKSVRQPKGPLSLLQTEEDIENYHLLQFLNNLDIFSTKDLERNYSIKPFQRSYLQQSNVSYTDVSVTLKDKKNKTVTIIGNFVCIDNGKSEPMLFLDMSNIQKLQGISKPNKNQFHIKLYRKTYIILTYNKALVAKDLPKEEQKVVSQKSSLNDSVQISSSLTSKVLAERCSQLTETKMKE